MCHDNPVALYFKMSIYLHTKLSKEAAYNPYFLTAKTRVMKILFIFFFAPLFASAQFTLQPRIGLNENSHAVVAMDIAYRTGCLEPAVTIDAVQHNTEAAYFNFRLGFIIPAGTFDVMLIGGQAYRYMTNDKASENYWRFLFGARIEKHLECMIDGSALLLQADYSDQLQITAGVKFKL